MPRYNSILYRSLLHGTHEEPAYIEGLCSDRLAALVEIVTQKLSLSSQVSASDLETQLSTEKFCLTAGDRHQLDEADKSAVRGISLATNCSALDSWNFITMLFNAQDIKSLSADIKSCELYDNLGGIVKLFLLERQSAVRILLQLLKSSLSQQHWFSDNAARLVQSLLALKPRLMSELVSCLSTYKMDRLISRAVSSGEHRDSVMASCLAEQVELAELIMWTSFHVNLEATDRVDVCRSLAAFLITRSSLTKLGLKPVLNKTDLFVVFSVISLLDCQATTISEAQDWKSLLEADPDFIRNLDEIIRNIPSTPCYGLVWIAWSGILVQLVNLASTSKSKILDEISVWIEQRGSNNVETAQVPVYVEYCKRAFESGTIEFWIEQLRSDSFLNSQAECKSVVKTLLSQALICFFRSFEVANLGPNSRLLELLCLCISPDSDLDTVVSQDSHLFQSFYEYASSTFPFRFRQFLPMITALIAVPSISASIFQAVETLLRFAQDAESVDASLVQRINEDSLRVKQSFNVFPNLLKVYPVVVPANTAGLFIPISGGAMVVWELKWSLWEFLGLFLTDMSILSRHSIHKLLDKETLSLLSYSLQFLKASIKAYTEHHVEMDANLSKDLLTTYFPKIMESCAKLFDKLAAASYDIDDKDDQCIVDVLGLILDCLEGFVSLFPGEIWGILGLCNLVPSGASSLGHLSALRQRKEASKGRYPLTFAFVNLLDRLLLEARRKSYSCQFEAEDSLSEVTLEVVKSFLSYFIIDVFCSFRALKFSDQFERNFIIWKGLRVLELALSDFAPRFALESKKQSIKSGPLAKFGEVVKSVVADAMLYDPSQSCLSVLLSLITPASTLLDNSQDTASTIAVSALETALKILQLLMNVRFEETDRQQKALMENKAILTYLVEYIDLPFSPLLPVRSSQILAQLIGGTDGQALCNIVDAKFLANQISRRLSRSYSSQLQIPLICLAFICVKTRPSVALKFLKSPGAVFAAIEKMLSQSELLLEERPEIVSALLGFYESLFAMSSASGGGGLFSETLESVRSNVDFWKCISGVLSKRSTSYDADDVEKRCHVNSCIAFAYRILTHELLLQRDNPKSKAVLDKQLSSVEIEATVGEFANVEMNPSLLQMIHSLNNEERMDLDIFRQVTWSKSLSYSSLDYGKHFAFSTLGLRLAQVGIISELEEMNLGFSLSDSQVIMAESWASFMSVAMVKSYPMESFKTRSGKILNGVAELVYHRSSSFDFIQSLLSRKVARLLVFLCDSNKSASTLPIGAVVEYLTRVAGYIGAVDKSSFTRQLKEEPTLVLCFNSAFSLVTVCRTSLDRKNNEREIEQVLCELLKAVTPLLAECLTRFNSISALEIDAVLMLACEVISILQDFGLGQDCMAWFQSLDLFSLSVQFVRAKLSSGAAASGEDLSFVLNSVTWLRVLSNGKAAQNLVSAGVMDVFTAYPAVFESTNPKRDNQQQGLFCMLLDLLRILLDKQNGSDVVLFNAIHILKNWQARTSASLLLLSNSNGNGGKVTMARLEEVELLTQIHFLLAKQFVVWKRRYGSFAGDYMMAALQLVHSLTDVLTHPHRFYDSVHIPGDAADESLAESPGKSPTYPKHRLIQSLLFQILRNVLFACYIYTQGWQTFLTTTEEWKSAASDGSLVVFMPVLEQASAFSGSAGGGATSLGTLNILLAYMRDRIVSTFKPSSHNSNSDSERKGRLESMLGLTEICFLVFSSQLMYALESPLFDGRQKELISAEVGGELGAACESYVEIFQQQTSGGGGVGDGLADSIAFLKQMGTFVDSKLVVNR